MIRKLTHAAVFGAGYVLGARAGKERYAQIVASAQDLAATPAVARFTGQAKDKATALAGDAVDTVKDKVGASDDAGVPPTGVGAPDPVVPSAVVDLDGTTTVPGGPTA